MKKIYFFFAVLLISVQGYAQYISPGNGSVFTFKSLSQIENSGVVLETENVYLVNADFTISVNDTLMLENNVTVKLTDLKTIKVEGHAEFTPQDTALITRSVETDNPKGLYIFGDNASANVKNVRFEYGGLKSTGKGIDVDNCTFTLVNTKLASSAIDISKGINKVTNSNFIQNVRSAIGSAANATPSLLFQNNVLYQNTTDNSNRPQINMGPSGNGLVEIIGNVIIGTGAISKAGGIGVGNLLGTAGGSFVIKDNFVTNHRYGITTNGKMDVKILNNTLISNKFEENPMNGGSAIAIYNRNNSQNTMISGNYMEDHLWGITIINSGTSDLGGIINLGRLNVPETDPQYNPGRNTFKNNGNGGMLYDLYNNTAQDIYAQGNAWNVAVQDSASIEEVVFHKVDMESLGFVYFMYHKETGVDKVYSIPFEYAINDNRLTFTNADFNDIKLFSISGALVKSVKNSNSIEIGSLVKGTYILNVTQGNKSYFDKVIFR